MGPSEFDEGLDLVRSERLLVAADEHAHVVDVQLDVAGVGAQRGEIALLPDVLVRRRRADDQQRHVAQSADRAQLGRAGIPGLEFLDTAALADRIRRRPLVDGELPEFVAWRKQLVQAEVRPPGHQSVVEGEAGTAATVWISRVEQHKARDLVAMQPGLRGRHPGAGVVHDRWSSGYRVPPRADVDQLPAADVHELSRDRVGLPLHLLGARLYRHPRRHQDHQHGCEVGESASQSTRQTATVRGLGR